ncbi:unnamed protein product [Protopolystoma xenopodis]|uniref:Uncharacterized protein n=1 Tax=Protopolystoma xenopodis TaxID=117903 RepID=A0A3S5CSZ0_9PLAT|nr:unnamed protein product [Protopolystoma xenopodis]
MQIQCQPRLECIAQSSLFTGQLSHHVNRIAPSALPSQNGSTSRVSIGVASAILAEAERNLISVQESNPTFGGLCRQERSSRLSRIDVNSPAYLQFLKQKFLL